MSSSSFAAGVVAGVGAAAAGYALYVLYKTRAELAAEPSAPPHEDPAYVQPVPEPSAMEQTVSALRSEAAHGRAKEQWKVAKEVLAESFKRNHPKGFGCDVVEADQVRIDHIFLLPVPHLGEYCPSCVSVGPANRMGLNKDDTMQQQYNQLLGSQDLVIGDIVRKPGGEPVTRAYLRGGPRKLLHFQPKEVRAAIVTCGGLCPGLNNIIQNIVRTLISLYGASTVLGIRGGYAGFHPDGLPPMDLTLESVAGINLIGGTILGSGRGGFDVDVIMAFLRKHRISQLYVVGGDGTHRAANKVAEEARRLQVNIAVVGVPKTIDNDIDLIDRSFGFNTAVEEAQKAIRSAQVEAQCNHPNGIGIVKLMGRHSGFIAVHSTLCHGEVDLCLVPEVPVVTEGPKGCFTHLDNVLKKKGHAVIVVAEGAGEEILGQSATIDKGGNRKLPELGVWLKDQLGKHFDKKGTTVTVKYIDPSYMIRSVKANAGDAVYCLLLAQNAVHGAMAGYTSFSVGLCNNRVVFLPISALVENSPRGMNPVGRTWERVVSVTGQPNTADKALAEKASKAFSSRTTL